MGEPERLPPPSPRETASWVGADLTALGGDRVGSVAGFYVDSRDGEPVWLVARLGRRRAPRVVALPLAECAGFPAGVWTAQDAEALRRAPVVDPIRPLRREHELTICGHFGIGPRVGRAAAVADRPENEITATPP